MASTSRISELAALDKAYDRLSKYASRDEKLRYCRSVIERTDKFVGGNELFLTSHIIAHSARIVKAAYEELSALDTESETP